MARRISLVATVIAMLCASVLALTAVVCVQAENRRVLEAQIAQARLQAQAASRDGDGLARDYKGRPREVSSEHGVVAALVGDIDDDARVAAGAL